MADQGYELDELPELERTPNAVADDADGCAALEPAACGTLIASDLAAP